MVEVCFVLKCVNNTVMDLIHRRSGGLANNESFHRHEQALLGRVYPCLVECVTCSDESVRQSLKVVLLNVGKLMALKP